MGGRIITIPHDKFNTLPLLDLSDIDEHALMVILGPAGSGKTRLLKLLYDQRSDGPLMNFGELVSKGLLDGERSYDDLVEDILGDHDTVYLDNIEILLDPYIARDPFLELVRLSRTRKVISTFSGHHEGGFIYAFNVHTHNIDDHQEVGIIEIVGGST